MSRPSLLRPDDDGVTGVGDGATAPSLGAVLGCVPRGLLHAGLDLVPRPAFILRVLGDRGLDVAGEVTPDTPRGLVRGGLLLAPRLAGGRPVLVA